MFQYKPLLGHLKEMIERTNAILRLHSPAPNQLICIPTVKIYTDKTRRHNMSMRAKFIKSTRVIYRMLIFSKESVLKRP